MSADPVIRGVDQCPDPETLAAFLDNRLSERDREVVAAHLTSCETCYAVFLETIQTKPAATVLTSSRWSSPPLMRRAAMGLAAAAALVLAVYVGLMVSRGSNAQPQLDALVAAVGTDRSIEPRLTGGFAHGPLRGALRGALRTPLVSPDVTDCCGRHRERAGAQISASADHARGVAALVLGDTDTAIVALERAAEREPTNARILSDLAAAYLVRAAVTSSPDDVSRALAMANRAVTVDRSLAEAWFNRALALERLGMGVEARDAWQGYLTIDDRSGWADEARTHLRTDSPR